MTHEYVTGDQKLRMNKNLKKILVIDDEAVFLEATIRALTPCGYSCIAEQKPSDGIMRLKKDAISLVLLDIMMDPVDGWDILSTIRSQTNGHDVPVMMSSAKKLHPDEVIRYGEKIDGFIIKPFVDAELCETITGFFTWYGLLLKNTEAAGIQGVSEEACSRWISLNRNIRAISQLMDVINHHVIPDDASSEELTLKSRMDQIHHLISEKEKERDLLRYQYPVFSI